MDLGKQKTTVGPEGKILKKGGTLTTKITT